MKLQWAFKVRQDMASVESQARLLASTKLKSRRNCSSVFEGGAAEAKMCRAGNPDPRSIAEQNSLLMKKTFWDRVVLTLQL